VIVWDAASRRRLLPSRLHDLATPDGGDPSDAVDALVAALDSGRRDRHGMPRGAVEAVARARHALVAAPEADYVDARARVRGRVEGASVAELGCLAGAFTAEAEWTHRAARGFLDRGARPTPLAGVVGPFVTDAALAEALAVATADSPRGLREHALDLVAHLGPDAVPALRAMLLHRFSDSSADVVARALRRIGTDDAGRVILPLAACRPLRKRALSWAKRWPDRAAPILRALIDAPTDEALDLAESSDIRSSLESVLAQIAPPAREAARWPAGTPDVLRATTRPKAASFLLPARLPPLRRADGAPLPAAAIERLAALAEADDPALEVAVAACEPRALAEVAHGVVEQWLAHGAAPEEDWALALLRHAADDARLDELVAHLEPWQRGGAHRRAGALLDALAARGTAASWRRVDEIARASEYRRLRARATEAKRRAAARAGCSVEVLEARRAATLGAGADGTLQLDAGRAITVRFDDTLRPLADGATALGRARASDDDVAFATAKARFSTLKAEAAAVAAQQRSRLERMMARERAVPRDVFARHLVAHPLLRPWVERLVWRAGEDLTFRVDEDGELLDVDDEPARLPADASIGLAHPLAMGAELTTRWAERFADYELTQPLAQLGRPVFAGALPEVEARVVGEIDWPALAALARAGFAKRTQDGLRYTMLEGEVAHGLAWARVHASPGLHVGAPTGSGRQRITRVDLELDGDATPIACSELALALAPLRL